jgi:hypothetical protein
MRRLYDGLALREPLAKPAFLRASRLFSHSIALDVISRWTLVLWPETVKIIGCEPVPAPPKHPLNRENLDAPLLCPYRSAVPWMDVILNP